MSFDLEKMASVCRREIEKFSRDHQDETFYAFAIDANMLCMNSVEAFEATLGRYRSDWAGRSRTFETWEDLSQRDLDISEHLLGLHEKYSGLDRSNKLACLNVINESRLELAGKGNPYLDEETVRDLRGNTGDWAYQGFWTLSDEQGFNFDAYQLHYDLGADEQASSVYAAAMEALLETLRDSGVFRAFKKTDDFSIHRVEHDY